MPDEGISEIPLEGFPDKCEILHVPWAIEAHADPKFLDLAKKSGLLHVNMGIESIAQDTLATMRKGQNKSNSYDEMIRNLNKSNVFGIKVKQERAP